jgi:hypothetical protein
MIWEHDEIAKTQGWVEEFDDGRLYTKGPGNLLIMEDPFDFNKPIIFR